MPTPVTGTLVDAATNLVNAGTFVRFLLKGTQGIQPVVTGVGALCVGSGTGPGYFVDFIPNTSGVISGSVYSTRDSTGLLAGEIKINGNGTACWWEVSIWRGNKKVSSVHTHAKTGATLDVGNLTALSTTPVATAPSGDSVYARIDASNQPFTGNVSMNGTLGVTGTSTFANVSLGALNTLTAANIKQIANTAFVLADPNGLSHFFISASPPYSNTFVNGNGAGVVFLGSAALASVADTTGNVTTSGNLSSTQTGGGSSAGITGKAAAPFVALQATGQAADQKWWDIGANGLTFIGRAVNDANSGSATWLTVNRSAGATIGAITFGAGGGTQTLPTATDTLVGKATTDIFTNKTIDTSSNTIKLNGATLNGIPSVMQFSCTGTATAGTTLSLSGGPCTNTSGVQFPVSSAATIANLRCKAQSAGVNASSGAVTVRKNGVAQTLTCTIGTGTTCSDVAHTFSLAIGDTVDLVFTTQGAETLANIGCTLEKQ